MKQKKISDAVAKAIKKAGYPLVRYMTLSRKQFEAGHGYKYSKDECYYGESPSILHPEDNDTIDMYLRPTYIEIWLWLDEQNLADISVNKLVDESWEADCCSNKHGWVGAFSDHKTAEDAIISAIEYLVKNDLII